MKGKNNFFILFFGEILFLITILIIIPGIFIREKNGTSVTNLQEILPLDTKTSYSQEIITDRNNLRSIAVLLKNPALLNKSQINIEILDQNKTVLRSLNTSGVSIGDPSWTTFEFPYIPSQKGDKFNIKITTDNTKLDSIYVYGNLKDKSINYKTTYKQTFRDNLNEQITKLHQINKIFLFSYLTLLLSLNIIIFLSL